MSSKLQAIRDALVFECTIATDGNYRESMVLVRASDVNKVTDAIHALDEMIAAKEQPVDCPYITAKRKEVKPSLEAQKIRSAMLHELDSTDFMPEYVVDVVDIAIQLGMNATMRESVDYEALEEIKKELQFYASVASYLAQQFTERPGFDYKHTPVHNDGGDRARYALERLEAILEQGRRP